MLSYVTDSRRSNSSTNHRFSIVPTTWGVVGLMGTPDCLQRVMLPSTCDQMKALELIQRQFPQATRDSGYCHDLQPQIRSYFNGHGVDFHAVVDLSGLSAFAQDVLQGCAAIPAGQTQTYGQLAEQVGRSGAARAVGSALAANPLPLIIPCHRVVGTSGKMCGFSGPGGISTKQRLLDLERQAILAEPAA